MDFVGVIVGLFDVRTVLIAGVIFIPLERLRPLHKGQHTLRKGWRTDVIYVFANGALLRMRLGALDQALGTDAALTNCCGSARATMRTAYHRHSQTARCDIPLNTTSRKSQTKTCRIP